MSLPLLYRMLLFVGFAFLHSGVQQSLSQEVAKPCRDCPLPAQCSGKDSVMKVTFRDKVSLDNCISAVRTMIEVMGRPEQAIKLSFLRATTCFDTTVAVESVESFSVVGLGLNGQPCTINVLPAREFVRTAEPPKVPLSFFEGCITASYAGSDKSQRAIGSASLVPGVELLIAPFGKLFGETFALALGGGAFIENNRTRFPLMGQARITLAGSPTVEARGEYFPSPCTFNGPPQLAPTSDGFAERPVSSERDSSVYYSLDKKLIVPDWRPFIFFEGGTILNSNFEGAGGEPSLNPDDYSQYFFGAGVGTPLFGWGTLSLAYRYMRLNVRTPCETCPPDAQNPEFYVVNTAEVNSIILKFGARITW